MRSGLLVYNPASGSQMIPDILDDVLAYGLDRGLFLVPFRLDISTEARALLTQIIQSSWLDFILVSGGDGTLSMIAQDILTQRPALPMGIIPSGTCNDFAESLHLPQDIWDCINVVAENELVALDVGQVNGRHIFLSTCAAGAFINISYSISSILKKNLGPMAYYFSALGELPNIRAFPLRIETETEVLEDQFLLFLLINGTHAAGLANLYSKARMRDGYMDLLLIRDVPPIELPNLLVELINRESTEDGRWFKRMKARRFRFDCPQDIRTTQDGEEGLPLPLDVEVLSRALKVYIRREE